MSGCAAFYRPFWSREAVVPVPRPTQPLRPIGPRGAHKVRFAPPGPPWIRELRPSRGCDSRQFVQPCLVREPPPSRPSGSVQLALMTPAADVPVDADQVRSPATRCSELIPGRVVSGVVASLGRCRAPAFGSRRVSKIELRYNQRAEQATINQDRGSDRTPSVLIVGSCGASAFIPAQVLICADTLETEQAIRACLEQHGIRLAG